MNTVIEQSGVIPFLHDHSGVKLLLITSRTCPSRWILPKGHLEANLSPRDSALKEAFEEAGIIGTAHPVPAGMYEYEKYGHRYRVSLFLMKINRILDEWPEHKMRNRQLLTPAMALKILSDANVREIVKNVLPCPPEKPTAEIMTSDENY